MNIRKVTVVTGTRAEYGVLYPVMKALKKHPGLKLSILATGMHLMPEFGYTVEEIERDGFVVDAKVTMYQGASTKTAIVSGVGLGITGIAQALEKIEPDIIVVLGDRGEPLAATIAAVHMNIPMAHIHGGDSTTGGCIDESIRHAITRFAHIHFPATKASAERLVRMGEEPWRIHVVGPLGIYAMSETRFISREEMCQNLGLDADQNIIVVVQHSVTTQVEKAPEQMRETMEALVELEEQAVVIYPNADAGGMAMIEVIKQYEGYSHIKTFKSLPYLMFVSLMKASSMVVGNSSLAIVEAPLFGLPAINIGIREEGRERGSNVIDVPHQREGIVKAIKKVLSDSGLRSRLQQAVNPYAVEREGAEKIANILSTIEINEKLLQKRLTY